ncbi:glycoside hydrolase family 32 protein [Paenibacillus sp.]|uniref:glycoside hydrolase family 32 protein n=1 Tax=Paenibacillus sp. TaxID=58172 RepID=UPI002810EF39|nr:glycoside hydrolase family 32 protein [Paenibacillus sp.]
MTHQERVDRATAALTDPATAVANERFRLRYHLMPPVGWMNDPNGLIYYKGEYHAFYQHYPFEPRQGPMHWGHAVSADLVHWRHLPIALAPSEPYDVDPSGSAGGCWSGSAVEHDGKLALVYTAHVDGNDPVEVQCIAVSEDGITFHKSPVNPVIGRAPDKDCFGFRDPKVWKQGDEYRMVVGYGKDGRGKALLYRSEDLTSWHYVGIAAESDGTMGDMWECPDLFPLGDDGRHVLLFSPMNLGAVKTMYLSGAYDEEAGTLTPAYAERLDYGFDFYAPQTFVDGQGRRILLAWMNIWGSDMTERADRWLGAMTIPRELTLKRDGTLRMTPVPELQALRGAKHTIAGRPIGGETGGTHRPALRGDALELVVSFDLRSTEASAFGLRVRMSADGKQYTEIGYRTEARTLYVDRSKAGRGDGGVAEVVMEPSPDGSLKLHAFLDRSSLELFANDGVKTMTNRIYPDPDSLGMELFAIGGPAAMNAFEAWELKSIW